MSATVTKSQSRTRAGFEAKVGKIPVQKVATYSGFLKGQIQKNQPSSSEIINAIRAGLPVRALEELRQSLGISMERLTPKLGLSKATLHRRKVLGRLAPEESGRVFRYARLMRIAVQVLEGEDRARQWLAVPQKGLGGAVPLDYAETEVGAREVEDLLGRIEFGVYS